MVGPVSKFSAVVEIDNIQKKTMVKLVFFRDVEFGDFGNWLGWLKSGKQFRGMLRVLHYLGNICLTCRIRIYKIDIREVKI
jgi:hypothetical protein